jgi:hypothetical protein
LDRDALCILTAKYYETIYEEHVQEKQQKEIKRRRIFRNRCITFTLPLRECIKQPRTYVHIPKTNNIPGNIGDGKCLESKSWDNEMFLRAKYPYPLSHVNQQNDCSRLPSVHVNKENNLGEASIFALHELKKTPL